MPTTRTPINRTSHARISPEATALFERGLDIQSCGDDDFWEADGGKRAEYIEINNRLHEMLNLKPWHPSPLDVYGEPPADDQHPEYWRQMVKLRAALMASTEGRWVEGEIGADD
ncbi:hypothetical protein [Bradyrhizobium diazoefficiens]